MNVVLAGLNARYSHTCLAIRALKAYVCDDARERPFLSGQIHLYENHVNRPMDALVRDLAAFKADVYGFSCYIWNIGQVLEICADLRRIRPEAVILLGGPEMAGLDTARHYMATRPAIDMILCGEGEEAVYRLLAGLDQADDSGSGVPGLSWREGSLICQMPAEGPVDPASLPFPYADPVTDAAHRLLYYETSRGCPYACAYCLSSIDRSSRHKPLGKVKDELALLADMSVQTVKLVDRTFNDDPRRAVAIWKFLAGLDTQTRFHFEIGAHLLDNESIEALAAAPDGRFQLEIGIQSIHPEVLGAVNRSGNVDLVMERIRQLTARCGVPVHLDLIAGLPGESMELFALSFNRVFDLHPDRLQVGILKILPGTPMCEIADRLGYRYSATPPYRVLSTDAVSYEDLGWIHDLAHMVDVYQNNGAFPETIRTLADRAASPHDLFSGLAGLWRDNGLFDRNLSRDEAIVWLIRYARLKNMDIADSVRRDNGRLLDEKDWKRFQAKWELI